MRYRRVEFSGPAAEVDQAEAAAHFASRGGSKRVCRQSDKRPGRATRQFAGIENYGAPMVRTRSWGAVPIVRHV
jgi:hypothetical protein